MPTGCASRHAIVQQGKRLCQDCAILGRLDPRIIRPQTVGPQGPTVKGLIVLFLLADNWTLDTRAPGPNWLGPYCPGPHCPRPNLPRNDCEGKHFLNKIAQCFHLCSGYCKLTEDKLQKIGSYRPKGV